MKKIDLNQLSMSWRGKRKKQNWQERQGKQEAEKNARMDGAYIQHIFSIYSAYIGTCWRPAGKKATTSFRAMRYAAMLLMLLTIGVGQMWADNTHVIAVAGENPNDYTVKVEANIGDNDTKWMYEFSKAGVTFEGKKLYVGSYNEKYGGVNGLDIHYYNGSTWISKCSPFTSWTTSLNDNQVYNKDNCTWYSTKTVETGARFYFDASTWDETSIKLVVGHANFQRYSALSNIANTKLYYGSSGNRWTDAMGIGVVGNTNASDGTNYFSDISSQASEYTGLKNYGLTSTSAGNVYLMVPNGDEGEQPTMHYYGTHYNTDALNSTQTIKYAVGVNGGSPVTLTSGYVPADIAISSYKFASGVYDAVSASSGSATLSQGGSDYSATVTAARTATTTYTVSNVHEDYSFVGWYSAADGGTLLSSELSYTFYPTSATTAYARFSKENNHSVTISRYCTSTSAEINNTSAKIGEITYSSIEAPEIYGYTFVNWTVGNGLSKHSSDAITSNPIRVITLSSGTYTLTANYTEVLTTDWKLIGDNTTNSPFGDDYSYASGKAMTKKSGYSANHDAYYKLNMEKTGDWGFKVASSSASADCYGWGTGDTKITFNRAKSGSKQDVYSGGQHELRFNPDGLGEYEFKIDYTASPCSVTVTFPTVSAVTFGKGTGGSTVTATYGSTSFNSGTKVQSGKTVRFTQTASTGYQFKEWNTNSSGGGTKLSESATYDHTVGATNNVYAIYNPKNYTITLNNEDATSAGTTSVTATYKANTNLTTRITKPTKEGYTFAGYYTEAAGTGTQLIDANGDFIANVSNYTDASRNWQKTDNVNLYAKWTQTVTLNGNGAGSSDGSVGVVYKKSGAVTSSFSAATRTGYTIDGYYTAASNGYQVFTAAGVMETYTSNIASWVNSSDQWCHAGATTLYAYWTANDYTVTLKPNGATTGDDQVVSATYDAAMPTTTTSSVSLVAPTRTGYTFGGYYQNDNGTGTQYYAANLSSANSWNQATDANIYAKWTANSYTVTLDVDEEHNGSTASATTSQSVTYDAATTTVPNRPTAANGYALDGYYTDQNGEGTKLINGDGTWIASVDGYTDGSGNWVYANNLTLFAYYKKAEITALTVEPGTQAPGENITVTPTIEPTPTGDTNLSWRVLQSNDNPVGSQPTFTPGEGRSVTFKAPEASGSYKIECIMRIGSVVGSGTVLDSVTTNFVVAGKHEVTIRYQDGDGRTIKASTEMEGLPLEWSDAITAPSDIVGYTFARWEAGDGVTISTNGTSAIDGTTTTTATIYIKASYDGNLTAVYNKKNVIYFNNTLGWEDVYVYFYNSDKYWDNTYGSGAMKNQAFDGDKKPYWEEEHGHMTQIEGTNIWYFDYTEAGYSTRLNVVFTEADKHNTQWFYQTKAVRRSDHKASLPMFVPENTKTETKNETEYYSRGCWTNYPENTGYKLKVYDGTTSGATEMDYKSVYFPFTEDYTLPVSVTMDLEAGKTYGFTVARADGTNYNYSGTFTATGSQNLTSGGSTHTGVQTNAAGDYTFTLSHSGDTYSLGVTYPVAANDWRIVYKDLAAWSGATHTSSWYHPSAAIANNSSDTEAKRDIVSFFWAYGSSPTLHTQQCSEVGAGSITWGDLSSAIDVSGYSSVLTKAGVYNFIFEQPAEGGSISLVGVEPYEGNFYIRTDCAGGGKWDNFRNDPNHLMTYSDYAEAKSGYSHYFCHWVTNGSNVKFVIANDYSMCITDSLSQDYGTVIANINSDGFLSSGDASIRFMWDQKTNKISRSYISGSSVISDRFLVLEGDAKMMDENGNTWSISGLNANEVNLIDDQNFLYERTIKVYPSARAKLTAKYNNNVQYFKGSEGEFGEETTIELLGGTYSTAAKYAMRIVYDFKTDRLVTAYIPSGEVSGTVAINADLMLIRDHQEEGQQLTFANDEAQLTTVKTVYGVMRFNRWTLNNRQHPEDHAKNHSETDDAISTWHKLLDAGNLKSSAERGLYWISFPFDVNLSDVFGFGTYGIDWVMMTYNGAQRAIDGYWMESDGFWEYIWDRSNVVLRAGTGYVLALDLDRMGASNRTFWANEIQEVELFFPSTANAGTIKETEITVTVPEHPCTIERDRRNIKDSHWNTIGVPSYANNGTLKDGAGNDIKWNADPETQDLPFLYEWNPNDNSYTVQSGTGYEFKAMHAYYVQYAGTLKWTLASATPPASVAARRSEARSDVEFRLEMQQNDVTVDQTFVKLSNKENITADFEFGYDLTKEFNSGKANIYTLVDNIPVAGNTMPLTEQTTVVPVGVKVVADGEYTFAISDGTEGIGVVLVDNIMNTRTNLGLTDYTVNLTSGSIDGRFVLEISPVAQTPTDINVQGDDVQGTKARKVMIDGILYIVKDGKVFDARGARVE